MSTMFNQLEKLKYTLDNEKNNSNGQSLDLLVKYFECRDNDIIDKLLKMNEEKEKKMRDETIFNANQEKIPKLDFENDNFDDWFYAVKMCIRKTTFYNYFEKKDIVIEKNYENELYDIMENSIAEDTKDKLQFSNVNKNPRKLLKEIVRVKQSIKSKKIKIILNYIDNHKYQKMDDIHQHLEILFMLFDELSKLNKNLSEEEKLEKILNSLPEEYSNNIKKLTNNNHQLGLSILYILKYIDIWNKKSSTMIIRDIPKLIENDNPFLYTSQCLSQTSKLTSTIYNEPEDFNITKGIISRIDQTKLNESIEFIKKEKEKIRNSRINKTMDKINDNNDNYEHQYENEKRFIYNPKEFSFDEPKICNSDDIIVKDRDISDINDESDTEEVMILKDEKKSIIRNLFSIKYLFIYFICMMIVESIIYFKYDEAFDTLKSIIS